MALAERVLDLLEAARRAVRLEEKRAATLAVGEQHLVVETHPHRHAQHGGVEALGARQVGDVHPEMIEPPDPHGGKDTA